MIILPSRYINRFCKKIKPIWQNKRERRQALLNFAGYAFWTPEDWALAGPVPPEVQMSVSSFPHGTTAAAAASYDVGTLTLNTLAAHQLDDFLAFAHIEFLRDSDVEENNTAQNSGTEWTDSVETDVGDYCECKMDHTSGTTVPNFSSGWAENTYITISATRQASISNAVAGTTKSSNGTAYVREIADTANVVSASYAISATVTSGGMMLIP